MQQIAVAIADLMLAKVAIPPQPAVLAALFEESGLEEPDLKRISSLIQGEAGLFSALLKLINSPYFGMRCEIRSVEHAITLLGMDNVITYVAAIKFREQRNQDKSIPMPRFWDSSRDSARLCAILASKLGLESTSDAYALGLFQDAGIAVLAQQFEGYKEVLKQQNESELPVFTQLEDDQYNTNHCIVGYLMAREWGMTAPLREACLYHHDIEFIMSNACNDYTRKLIITSKIVDNVLNKKRGSEDREWSKLNDFILSYLGLETQELADLQQMLLDDLMAKRAV